MTLNSLNAWRKITNSLYETLGSASYREFLWCFKMLYFDDSRIRFLVVRAQDVKNFGELLNLMKKSVEKGLNRNIKIDLAFDDNYQDFEYVFKRDNEKHIPISVLQATFEKSEYFRMFHGALVDFSSDSGAFSNRRLLFFSKIDHVYRTMLVRVIAEISKNHFPELSLRSTSSVEILRNLPGDSKRILYDTDFRYKYIVPDLLLIEDFSMFKVREFQEPLFKLLKGRMLAGKKTIIISTLEQVLDSKHMAKLDSIVKSLTLILEKPRLEHRINIISVWNAFFNTALSKNNITSLAMKHAGDIMSLWEPFSHVSVTYSSRQRRY